MNTDHSLPEARVQTRAALDFLNRPMGRGSTLLLIEDSRQTSDSVRLMFQGALGRMRRADSLAAARRHLSLYLPDAVLVDLGLPDGSGLDLIVELARHRPRIPLIIAMSGQPELEADAIAAGADRFLAKPFESIAEFRTALAPIFFPQRDPAPREHGLPINPVALRDDLYLALALLCAQAQPDRRDYALQFTAGLSRTLRDPVMLEAVSEARATGSVTALELVLRQRLREQPLI